MVFRRYIFLILITLFFLLPQIVFAAAKSEVIFSLDFLADPLYQTSPNQWQIFNNADQELYVQDDGSILFNSDGDFEIVYPISFSYQDFDKLVITLATDTLLEARLIPDIKTTADTSHEFDELVFPAEDFQEVHYSLRHRFFKDVKNEIGINFESNNPGIVKIKEIRLEKNNPAEVVAQAVYDYFRPAPYLPFTVNLFSTPLIFGRTAMLYFLPLVVLALILFLKSNRRQKNAAIFLLIIFFLTDIRMSYEFLSYSVSDYKTFVQPAEEEKVFRNYGDFYSFANWLDQALPQETQAINYMSSGSSDFFRILHYELYPLHVSEDRFPSQIYVVFNRGDIRFSAKDKVLFDSDGALTEQGELVDIYNKNSFIFIENEN